MLLSIPKNDNVNVAKVTFKLIESIGFVVLKWDYKYGEFGWIVAVINNYLSVENCLNVAETEAELLEQNFC